LQVTLIPAEATTVFKRLFARLVPAMRTRPAGEERSS
jgi:hypothetical protein